MMIAERYAIYCAQCKKVNVAPVGFRVWARLDTAYNIVGGDKWRQSHERAKTN